MTEPSRAVFLSYASQDAEAAKRICEALRAGGIEVWFDQSELRGGDAWDAAIRKQIKSCALFVPVISVNTHARDEGYFRLEWKLAVDRSHLMTGTKAFLLPVVIDNSRDVDEHVPDKFRELQWTRLPGGETPPGFVARISQLLSPGEAQTSARAQPATGSGASFRPSTMNVAASQRSKLLPLLVATALLLSVGYFALTKFVLSKRTSSPTITSLPGESVAFAPPAHSIAVLPFVNMSGDREQEYFSEGLTEELLNSLAEINELQVAARTSAFSFKGTNTDIGTIARKLNVASVLEGSVRRSGNTVRITAQLINAATGFHLWSHTYDRDLGDVLKLETDIASAVASALKVSLLGDVATKIELGGTRNSAAFDAYLRGRKTALTAHGGKDQQTAIAAFSEAIELDPNYALAYAHRSLSLSEYAGNAATGSEVRESFDKSQSDGLKSIALAPDLADGHLALASYFAAGALDFTRANEQYDRALALAPGNAQVLRSYGSFAVFMGRTKNGVAAARHAVVLDPLNRNIHNSLGQALYFGRLNKEALGAYQDALALDSGYPAANLYRGLAYYALGDFEGARASCETEHDYIESQACFALTDDKLGRHGDAESSLAKLKATLGDASAYQYAEIYGQWGNQLKALEWLDTAMRLRDPGLVWLKTDPLMDPLREEPRFQAVMRELKFPD